MLDRICSIKVVITIVAAVLLAALLLFSWIYSEDAKIEQEQEAYEDSAEGTYSQLIAQSNELQQKIDDCQYQLDYGAMGPMAVLFSEPEEALEDTGVKTIGHIHAKAILAVSEDSFPGDSGCLSIEVVKSCREAGWEIALSCTPETDIKALNKRLSDAGLGGAAAVYYPDEEASVDTKAAKAAGINRVLQYGKNIDGFVPYGIASSEFKMEVLKGGNCMVAVIGSKNEREKTDDVSDWVIRLRNTAKSKNFLIQNLTEASKTVANNRKFNKEEKKQIKKNLEQYKKEQKEIEKKIDGMKEEYE